MEAFLYILEDGVSGKFYVGSTDNLERRLYQHQHGHTTTIKRMANVRLVFSQKLESLDMARKLEKKIKKLKRRDYLEKIIQDGIIRKLV